MNFPELPTFLNAIPNGNWDMLGRFLKNLRTWLLSGPGTLPTDQPVDTANDPFVVAPPVQPIPIIPNSIGFMDLTGKKDRVFSDITVTGQDYGVDNENSVGSQRIQSKNFKGLECKRYGMYACGCLDHWHDGMTLVQAAGATEHGLRLGNCKRMKYTNLVVDTTKGGKSSFWFYGSEVFLVNPDITGGDMRFGCKPFDMNGAGAGFDPTKVWIKGGKITYNRGSFPAALNVWPNVELLSLENFSINGGRGIDLDTTTPVICKNVSLNGKPIRGGDFKGDISKVQIS